MTLVTSDLRVATHVERVSDGTFALEVPEGWLQGRGVFGGLTLAAMTRAVMASEADPARSLRSLTSEIVGPVLTGAAEIRVEPLRIGNAVSSYHARLLQQGETLAVATFVTGRARAEAPTLSPNEHDRPTMPPWETLSRVFAPGISPVFMQYLDLRATAHPPFAGEPEGRAAGWVRAMVRPPRFDAADIVALADAWWPSLFSMLRAPRPMSTIGFSLQLLVDPSTLDPEQPLFHRGHAVAGADGYVFDLRELWSADGRLVSLNPQTFVVIK